MEAMTSDVKAIAFDADDTLWDCQSYFDEVEADYCDVLSAYGKAKDISRSLFEVESGNMDDLGYGSKAFTISLVENAVKVSHGRVSGDEVQRIITLGKSLLHLPATPLDGVADTLERLHDSKRYKLAVFTKGELQDQQNKLSRSGLSRFFDKTIIVADKTEKAYRQLCASMDAQPGEMCMVGNSFKSDVKPALDLGMHAVWIPFHTTWQHERVETFDHPQLKKLERFANLIDIFA